MMGVEWSSDSGASGWVKAHAELSEFARRRATQDWEEGGLLLQALRTGAHRHLGFGAFAEYVERLFGYSPRATEEKLRVARALEGLPEVGRALRDGELNWSAVREVTRVALPETEGAWRPVEGLLNKGFRKQIAAVVVKANEIAEEEGEPGKITDRRMLLAKRDVWAHDPEIRQWAEQPGQTLDARSAHDRVVAALNHIRKEANDLRRQIGDNPKAWAEFLAGLAEIK